MPVWNADTEQDMFMAMVGYEDGSEKIPFKVEWPKVIAKMKAWGHSGVTKDSLQSHWHKVMLKSFKARRAAGPVNNDASSAPHTPASRKRKRATKAPATPSAADDFTDAATVFGGDEDDFDLDDNPVKRAALAAGRTPLPNHRPQNVKPETNAESDDSPVKHEALAAVRAPLPNRRVKDAKPVTYAESDDEQLEKVKDSSFEDNGSTENDTSLEI